MNIRTLGPSLWINPIPEAMRSLIFTAERRRGHKGLQAMQDRRSRPAFSIGEAAAAPEKIGETGEQSAPSESAERELAFPEAVANDNFEISKFYNILDAALGLVIT